MSSLILCGWCAPRLSITTLPLPQKVNEPANALHRDLEGFGVAVPPSKHIEILPSHGGSSRRSASGSCLGSSAHRRRLLALSEPESAADPSRYAYRSRPRTPIASRRSEKPATATAPPRSLVSPSAATFDFFERPLTWKPGYVTAHRSFRDPHATVVLKRLAMLGQGQVGVGL